MSTLDELITKYSKVPGDIKVRCEVWHVGLYFIPYFKTSSSIPEIHGLDQDGRHTKMIFTLLDWELYTEPEVKVKLLLMVLPRVILLLLLMLPILLLILLLLLDLKAEARPNLPQNRVELVATIPP